MSPTTPSTRSARRANGRATSPSFTRTQVLAHRVRALGLDRRASLGARGGFTRTTLAVLAVLDLGVQDVAASSAAVLALATRVGGAAPDVTAAAVREELDRDERLTAAWSVRGAPHVHRRADLPTVAAAQRPLSDRDAANRFAGKRLTDSGIPPLEAYDLVVDAVARVVDRPMSKGEASAAVSAAIPSGLVPYCRACESHHVLESLFRQAALPAGLELLPSVDKLTLAPMAGWVRPSPDATDATVTGLVRTYLALLGPATRAEVAGFVGAPTGDLPAVWPDDVVEVSVEDRTTAVPADRIDALASSAKQPLRLVRLLPPHDPYLQGRDRDLLVPERRHQKALWRPIGNPGAVLADGEIAGVWRTSRSGRTLVVTVEPFGRLPAGCGASSTTRPRWWPRSAVPRPPRCASATDTDVITGVAEGPRSGPAARVSSQVTASLQLLRRQPFSMPGNLPIGIRGGTRQGARSKHDHAERQSTSSAASADNETHTIGVVVRTWIDPATQQSSTEGPERRARRSLLAGDPAVTGELPSASSVLDETEDPLMNDSEHDLLKRARDAFRRASIRREEEQAQRAEQVKAEHGGDLPMPGRFSFAASAAGPARPDAASRAEGESPDADASAATSANDPRIGSVLLDCLSGTDELVGVFGWPGGEALWVNDALEDLSPTQQSYHWPLMELLDEGSQAQFLVRTLPVLLKAGRWSGELRLRRSEPTADGVPGDDAPLAPDVTVDEVTVDEVTVGDVTVSASLIAHRAHGEVDAFTLIAHEIGEPRSPRDLDGPELATGHVAALVQHVSDLILVVDIDGKLSFASPAASTLLGVDETSWPDGGLLSLLHPDDRPTDVLELAKGPHGPVAGSVAPLALRVKAADGTWHHLEVIVADLTANAAIGGLLLTATDRTDELEASAAFAALAHTDELTGLPNKARLLDHLAVLARRQDDPRDLALLLVDLDHFKRVNDVHGRAYTDALLSEISRRLVEAAGDDAFVARLRSDEFAVLLTDVDNPADARAVADRLRTAVAAPIDFGGSAVSVTASVGIAMRQTDDLLHEVLSDADRAMRRAKDGGRDRAVEYDGNAARRDHRQRSLDHHLRRILDGDASGGLQIRYQPVVRVDTTALTAAEALLRVRGEDGELLNPAAFVEAAESGGLIAKLGAAVLRTACSEIASVSREAGPLDISVNVSPRQLAVPEFTTSVRRILDETGLEPSQLSLEITEGAFLGRTDASEANILRLRDLGVRVGLDEFGSGQTSIYALRRFPLDFVKIDRSLIAGLGANYVDGTIVRATIELVHKLGLSVVAVGVETETQLEQLRQLGCDRAQGYLFSAAVEADALHALAGEQLG